MTTPIFKEYCSYLHKYKEKYGEKTVLLMQVGSFYEIYAVLKEDQEAGEINIYHICQNIMNIAVAKKTNDILMGGFQLPYSEKFIKLLIEHGYSIVIVKQVSEPPNPDREVIKIISPGTYMEYTDATTSYVMSVYIEHISQSFVAAGISIIDVSTGNNYVYQIGENLDPNFWKDELSRLINYYSPKEYLFQTHNYELTEQDIINYWDIQNSTIQVNHYKEKAFVSVPYQNELLQKVFRFESLLSPIDQLDMIHTHEMRNSYIYMLQYIHDHSQDIIQNIHQPEKINDIHHLSLTSNSVRQLNVIQNYSYYKGKHESLYTVCDECGFIGGKRLLKKRLLYPSVNPEIIQERYARIECCMKDDFYKEFKADLGKLTDTEKSLRKMGLDKLDTQQFMNAKLSYDFIIRILQTIQQKPELLDLYSEYSSDILVFRKFYDKIQSLFDFSHFYSNDLSYFKVGIHKDLDDVSEIIQITRDHLKLIALRLSGMIDAKNACKFDNNDKHGYFLYCTKKRSILLGKRFQNIPNHTINIRDTENTIIYEVSSDVFTYVKKDNNNVFIKCPEINMLTDRLETSVEAMKVLNNLYWSQTMKDLYEEYHESLLSVHNFVSDLDVTCSAAKIASEHKYCKPDLIESDKSCFAAQDMRHPIVERITTDTEYITNDITLGKDNKDGMLLFGTNACGKSTLMKAVGLNVIMAQAGLFVPCSQFQLKPYTHIFTRILNNDNMFRSQSSFAVEMMELRSIFQMGNANSLVLGDELCSGTETLSAISIVSKSLDILSKKQLSYVITTHLHQLTDIPLVEQIPNLDIYHLKIHCDDNVLVYDRKLCSGSGPPIYGLKVCEAMGLSEDFIKGSNDILRYLTNKSDKIVNTKVSHYSSSVFMDECKVCGGLPEETHHIKEQHTADEHNMIDHHHKNKKHNLVPLCKACHAKVTYGGLEIYGWKHTSRGKMLDYAYVTKETNKYKKFTDKQIQIILGYKEVIQRGDMSKVTSLNIIDTKHGFRPSMKIFNAILNGSY